MSEKTNDIELTIAAILDELAKQTDRSLGGPAANAARENARRVAQYLLKLHADGSPLPRHAGKAAPGKVAKAMSEVQGFNRQNFQTNVWCARLLDAYDRSETERGSTRLGDAQAGADEKEPQNKRISELERELLLARAEAQQLRRELGTLRNLIASTGQVP